jgi:hypothetical protein
MSCNRCATQSEAAMSEAGVPARQAQATWASGDDGANRPENCPTCGAFLPRDGQCIVASCKPAEAIPGWRAEKRGVLPFATERRQLEYTYKLGKSPRQTNPMRQRHFMYRLALDSPGEKVVRYREDDGYEYEYWAIYDEEHNAIRTNIPGCPHQYNHHLYMTCPTCGQYG